MTVHVFNVENRQSAKFCLLMAPNLNLKMKEFIHLTFVIIIIAAITNISNDLHFLHLQNATPQNPNAQHAVAIARGTIYHARNRSIGTREVALNQKKTAATAVHRHNGSIGRDRHGFRDFGMREDGLTVLCSHYANPRYRWCMRNRGCAGPGWTGCDCRPIPSTTRDWREDFALFYWRMNGWCRNAFQRTRIIYKLNWLLKLSMLWYPCIRN